MKLNNQPVQFNKRETIVRSVEFLLLITVAFNFAAWGYYDSLTAKLLGIFTCIYVFNNWLTTYSSFDIYKPEMFFTDIIVIFLSLNLPNSLSNYVEPWGYNPQFWLLLGVMELVNVYWNYQIFKVSPSEAGRAGLKVWLVATVIAMLGCFVLYFYLCSSVFSAQMGFLFTIILTLLLLGMTIKWNLNRYQMAKKEGISFLD